MEKFKSLGFMGFPNYSITGNGMVFSHKNNKWLKFTKTTTGYYYVNLCNNSTPKPFRVHRLVGAAFLPNPKNKPYINHIDGNKLNNHVSNLEWSTPSENNKHAYKLGLKSPSNLKGSINGMFGKTGALSPFSKKVLCIETGQIFVNIREAAKWANLKKDGHIGCVCKGKRKNAGLHPETKKPLSWAYVNH